MGKQSKDLKCGSRNERLVAVKFLGILKGHYIWQFRCDCGNVISARKSSFMSGDKKSCGCLKRELDSIKATKMGVAKRTHGMGRTRFYKIWNHMIERITNPNIPGYKNYGGRGIVADKRWHSFAEFKEDMYDSYLQHVLEYGEKNTTIDRINVNKHYVKSNVRWATRKQQAQNKTTNRYHTLGTQTECISEWERLLGFKTGVVHSRIFRGWDVETALTTPVRGG